MNELMKIAKECAENGASNGEGGPFGAVIADKEGNIVAKGNNMVLQNNDPTAHAEIVAIRDACKNLGTFDLTGCEIYTSCYPCPMCLSAIIWSNIKMVYYGNTKEDAEKIGFRDNLIYEYLEGQSKTTNKEDILKIIAMDREETIKTFESYQNKSENKTMY